MKVLLCFISAEPFWPPNIEIQYQTLAREFSEDTYYVVCLESTQSSLSSHPDNMEVIAIQPGRLREWTRYWLLSGGIARLAEQLQVDLIWSINIGPYHRSGIPQIVSLRNAFEIYPRDVARIYEYGSIHLAIMRHYFRKSLRNCDGVVVQTPLIAEYLREIRVAPGRIAVIRKAVESSEEVSTQPLSNPMIRLLDGGLGRGVFTFVYAASHTLHKNHAVLVRAMEILRSQEVKARIALTVSTSQLFATTGDTARSLVETGHLLPLGRVGKEHLRPLYDACDGCVMPSLLESLSSSHLEAMHWEKPQISADLPFAHEACGDGSLYARPTDPADWAAKMRILTENPALRDKLVQAGRRQMERYPKTWTEMVRRLRQFMQEVIDSTGRRGDRPHFRPTKMGLSPSEVNSGGLSQFSFDENGTVPFAAADRPTRPKMRILIQHISRSDAGGGFLNVAALVKTIIRNNPHDQFLFVCLESSLFYPIDGCNNVEFIRLKPARSLELQRFHLLLRGLPRIVRHWRPDVIWSFNLGPYVRTGVPQVVGIINAFQVYPQSIARHHPRGALHTAFIRWFSRLTLKKSDAAIVETSLMADYVRKVPGAPSRILVAPKAVGPPEASPPRALPAQIARLLDAEPGKGAFTFVYMANCVSHKNHKTIIKAAEELRSGDCPNFRSTKMGLSPSTSSPYKFRLALTSTEKGLVAAGGATAQDLIRDGYILPLGFIALDDLHAVYDACDACVMPSLLESQSSSHLEAMQWRKPQICADLPYAHDLCGDAAIYAEAENPADWAAKMRTLMEDRALCERLVAAGLARMKSFPETWQQVAQQVHSFLAEVADKK